MCFCPVQALVYFAVPKKGAKPIDGKTDLNPEGLTAVAGKHAEAFATRVHAGNLSCKARGGRCCTLGSCSDTAPCLSQCCSYAARHA